MPKANLALYAKWIAPEYKVSFISEGKTIQEVNVPWGETVAPIENPTKTDILSPDGMIRQRIMQNCLTLQNLLPPIQKYMHIGK